MFVANSTWNRIRAEFSEQEKNELRSAIAGESICPPGLMVDDRRINPELVAKLQDAMARVAPGA